MTMKTPDKLIALWTSRYVSLMKCADLVKNNPDLQRDLMGTASAYRQCANELCEPPDDLFRDLKIT
jgi:hypothetical protein